VRFLLTNLCKGPHYCFVKRGIAVAAWLIPLIALSFTAGCASSNLHSERLAKIERQLVELRRSHAESRARREEMNNKLLLLQEIVVEDRRVVDNLKRMTFSAIPPENLRVVKLSESGGRIREEGETDKAGEKAGDATEDKRQQRLPEKLAEKLKEKRPERLQAERVEKSEPTKPTTPVSYEPEDFYRRGQDLFWSGKLKEAVNLFKRFTEEYPKHHLADNALYWTGEAYYSQEKYREALDEFMGLIEEYPKGNKAPDALLKVAYSYMELDRNNEAEKALMNVIDTYPGSESAIKAKQTLTELFTNRRGEQ